MDILLTKMFVLMLQKPKGDLSAEDAYVCHYHDAVFSSDIYPKPIIQLPV